MNTDQAKTFGAIAYAKGMKCAPALDADFMATLKGRQIGDKRTIPEMKAWHQGWMQANLSAPL